MAELEVADVRRFTGDRLDDADDEALQALLNAALGLARRYCGWHVTPVREDDEIVIDGPGSSLLVLPTLRLVEITELAEDGTELGLTDLRSSSRGLVRKKSGACWSRHYSAIEVTMTHGFAEAPEWQSAVLSYIDRSSMVVAGGGREIIGPFTFAQTATAVSSAFTDPEKAILDLYRLEMAP